MRIYVLRKLECCFMDRFQEVTRCSKEFVRVFKGCFKGFSSKFQGGFMEFEGVSRVFQGSFKKFHGTHRSYPSRRSACYYGLYLVQMKGAWSDYSNASKIGSGNNTNNSIYKIQNLLNLAHNYTKIDASFIDDNR